MRRTKVEIVPIERQEHVTVVGDEVNRVDHILHFCSGHPEWQRKSYHSWPVELWMERQHTSAVTWDREELTEAYLMFFQQSRLDLGHMGSTYSQYILSERACAEAPAYGGAGEGRGGLKYMKQRACATAH